MTASLQRTSMSKPEPIVVDPVVAPDSDDGPTDLRAAALMTLKRRPKPPDGALPKTTNNDTSIQLDYGQDDIKQTSTDVEMPPPPRVEPQSREDGEISDSEDASLKAASKAMLVVLKSDSQGVPERPRDFPVPTLPPGEVYLDENHVRPGLAMNQGQYDTAKDIVLDLLGWGVPPDYLVDCNLSREIIFYVFSELNLRLPPNLDVTGLVQYTPSIVAKHSRSLLNRPSDASSRPTLPDKPSAGTTSPAPPSPPASASTLHDIERQRREELLARKAVQASRKTKVSDDSAAPDQDVEMPTVPVANEAVDDFLKSIGDTSASPEVKPEPTDAMDVDDVILAAGGSVGSPSNGAATPDLAIQSEPTDSPPPTDEAADAQVPKKRASRRGTKRPTAADFVDIDTGSRNGHRGAVPPMKRKSASFASVSGQRKLVIDLSDSEGGDEPMPDAETDGGSGYASPAPGRGLATPPVAPASLVEKEEQIRKMKDLIAQREKSRLQKTLTRSTPAESVRDDTIKDSVPQSAIAATPQADTEVPAASTEDSTMPGKDATIGQDTQEPVAVEVESASSSAQRQTPTTIPVHPKRDASPREERKFEHYAPYSSLLSSYPHLLATASRFSSSNPSLSSSSSIPCAPSSSISSLPSASSAAVPLPSLKPLRLATATKRVCQYEVPGGGTCRDAGCEDIHLGQMGSLEPSDSETVEYVLEHLPAGWVGEHGASAGAFLSALGREEGVLEGRVERALSKLIKC